MPKLIYSGHELKTYPTRKLVGTEELPIGDVVLWVGIEGENHPQIKPILDKYRAQHGSGIGIGPVLDRRGREVHKQDGKDVIGIYVLS